MTYDPPHRNQPPPQGRWPGATPAEPWQAYREEDSYPYGVPAAADRQDSYWATASVGSRSESGYTDAARGAADQRYSGYHANPPPGRHSAGGYPALSDGYADGQHDWNQTDPGQHSWQSSDRSQHEWDGNVYRDAGTGEYGAQASHATQTGYGTQTGYDDGFDGAQTGYGDGFDGAPVGQDYGRAQNGYAGAAQGYGGELDGYRAPDEYGATDGYRAPDEYAAPGGYGATQEYAAPGGYDIQDDSPGASGYAGNRGNLGGTTAVAEAPYGYYRDPDDFTGAQRAPAGTVLAAPDADVYPEGWQADQENRRESRRRGLLVGAMTGFLATATASAVSILTAAFIRPQASPILAVYDVFSDRMPAVLRDFTAHFGTHGRTVLLLGLYISVALLGLVIGMLARRAAALGVAGLAALSVLGAFVTITRPQGQVIDVLPAMAGGLAGVLALLWLRRASAPIVALRPALGNEPRRAR